MATFTITTDDIRELKDKAAAFRELYGEYHLKAEGTLKNTIDDALIFARTDAVEVAQLGPSSRLTVRNWPGASIPARPADWQARVVLAGEVRFTFMSKEP